MALSQGYEEGWNGYLMQGEVGGVRLVFPWWFGESLEQVKVNGWSNGFVVEDELPDNSRVVMVYWPQYLQWTGFGLLGVVVIGGGLVSFRRWGIDRSKTGGRKKS